MIFQHNLQQAEQALLPSIQVCPSPNRDSPCNVSTSSSSNSFGEQTIFLERPKRALTSYNYFFQAQRQRMLAEQKVSGKKVGFAGMARTVATMWKNMDVSEKSQYEALAAQDKARHSREMSIWKKAKKEAEAAASNSSATSAHAATIQNQRPAPTMIQSVTKPVATKPMTGMMTMMMMMNSYNYNNASNQSLPSQNEQKQQADSAKLSQALSQLLSQETGITSALRQGKSKKQQFQEQVSSNMAVFNQLLTKPPTPMNTLQPLAPPTATMDSLPEPWPMEENKAGSGLDESSLDALEEFSETFWSVEDDFSPELQTSNNTSLRDSKLETEPVAHVVMGALAHQMGHECTDLFVDLFRD